MGTLPWQKEASQDDFQLVNFKGFAMTGKEDALGTFRYKEGSQNKQKEVKPGQLGPRVLRAQLLSAGQLCRRSAGSKAGRCGGRPATAQDEFVQD